MDKSLEDDSQALRYIAGIAPLFVLGLLCFSARIISRIIPTYRLNASDYVNASAVVSIIVAHSLFAVNLVTGFGRHSEFLSYAKIFEILRFLFFSNVFSTIGVTLARLSIALQLLPFSTAKAWKTTLWVLVAFEAAAIVSLIFYFFLNSRPLSANWDGTGFDKRSAATFTFVAVSIFGDLVCSMMPLFLIWDLSRSKLERCLLSLLSTLGLLAAAAAITTSVLLARMPNSSDALRDCLPLVTGCMIEQDTLILASCAPLLKGPVERALSRLGFPVFHNTPRELGEFSSNEISQKSRWYINLMWHRRDRSASQVQGLVQDDTTVSSGSTPNFCV